MSGNVFFSRYFFYMISILCLNNGLSSKFNGGFNSELNNSKQLPNRFPATAKPIVKVFRRYSSRYGMNYQPNLLLILKRYAVSILCEMKKLFQYRWLQVQNFINYDEKN
jgi:hypothetical protein